MIESAVSLSEFSNIAILRDGQIVALEWILSKISTRYSRGNFYELTNNKDDEVYLRSKLI